MKLNVLQLAFSAETATTLKWITEVSRVIKRMGGHSFLPAQIGRTEPALRHSGCTIVPPALNNLSMRKTVRNLTELAKQNNIDAYIAHDQSSASLAQTLCKFHVAPIIFISRNDVRKANLLGLGAPKINWAKIDHLIVPSTRLSDKMRGEHRLDPRRVSVVREGVELTPIGRIDVSPERTTSLARSWGAIEDACDLVLLPAHYQNAQWVKSVKSFFAHWNSQDRLDVKFVFIGDDDGTNTLEKLRNHILTVHPMQSFNMAGHCADIDAAIKLSSVVMILDGATAYSFPMAIVSQSMGRKVLLPDNPASPEFSDGGVCAVITDNSAASFSSHLVEALGRTEGAQAFDANSGRNFVADNYSQAKMHEDLELIMQKNLKLS